MKSIFSFQSCSQFTGMEVHKCDACKKRFFASESFGRAEILGFMQHDEDTHYYKRFNTLCQNCSDKLSSFINDFDCQENQAHKTVARVSKRHKKQT